MNLQEYQQLAVRTMADSQGHALNKLTCGLGLVGELIELSEAEVNFPTQDELVKEAGDVLWYCAALAHLYGIQMDEQFESGVIGFRDCPGAYSDPLRTAIGYAGYLAERVKKNAGHGHPIADEQLGDLRENIGDIVAILWERARSWGSDLPAVMEANIEKLRRRYPNGFNTADSIARVDVLEAVP